MPCWHNGIYELYQASRTTSHQTNTFFAPTSQHQADSLCTAPVMQPPYKNSMTREKMRTFSASLHALYMRDARIVNVQGDKMSREYLTGMVETLQGRLGDEIGYVVRGRQRWRRYVKPADPRTKRQLCRRRHFARLVSRWHGLNEAEKARWNDLARRKPLTGFNLFLSAGMKEFEARRRVLEIKSSVRSSRRFVRIKKRASNNSVMYPGIPITTCFSSAFQYQRE